MARGVRESEAKGRLTPARINRRKFLRLVGTAGLVTLGVDSLLIEPVRPRLVRREISLRRWPAQMDGFTIALLSDFHYDPVFSIHPIKSAVEIANGLRPDLIVLTGDFVTVPLVGSDVNAASAAEPCAQLLSRLQAPHGVWAIMGNHDAFSDPRRVTSALLAHGIPVLSNLSTPIERNAGRFWLAGVEDVSRNMADLPTALQRVPANEAVVLLAHEPDYADYVSQYPVDLQLSGHSHGGQVRLPLIPPLYLPDLAKKYYLGLYRIGDLTLYTNAGLGTIRLPMRLNCPPEVTLITVRRSGV